VRLWCLIDVDVIGDLPREVNIVSFMGLFCKRDIQFQGEYVARGHVRLWCLIDVDVVGDL